MDLQRLIETPPWEWAKGTDEIVIDLIADPQADNSDRVLAAEIAGELAIMNNKIPERLLALLQQDDGPDELRGLIALALGPTLEYADEMGFDEPDDIQISEELFQKIQDVLHQLYTNKKTSENLRKDVFHASAHAPQDWHPEAISTAWQSDDPDWKLEALFMMGLIGGFDEEIIEGLKSDNPDIHFQAIAAAGHRGLEAAWSHISELVSKNNRDKELLLISIMASAGIRPHETAPGLGDLLKSDDEEIAEAAHEAMAMQEDFAGGIPDLLDEAGLDGEFDDEDDDESD